VHNVRLGANVAVAQYFLRWPLVRRTFSGSFAILWQPQLSESYESSKISEIEYFGVPAARNVSGTC